MSGRFTATGTAHRSPPTWPLALTLVAMILSGSPTQAAEAEPIAQVQQGRLSGERDEGLRIFRGIPFAKAPLGSLRWRPPEPPEAWDGVRDAKHFADACIQVPNPVMNVPTQPVSEDCLYLNVWTPADGANDRLSVLFWIHGGGFNFGSTAMPLFDGAALARKGVVVVSTAYRLGALGFLAHPELSEESPHDVSGNYGLLDQIAALRWVRDNIAAFGGDPDRVTIMGESAGAASVSMLVQSPLANGLFRGAIAQSGGSFRGRGAMSSRLSNAEQAGSELAKELGATTALELRALSADEILQASQSPGDARRLYTRPVYDGHVLADDPVTLYREGRQNDVPVVMGSNDREGDFFARGATLIDFRKSVSDEFGERADDVLAAYPAENDAEAERSAADLAGDRMFGIQHWTWARLQSRYGESPIFYYHFDQDPPAREGIPPGPIHGAELPYVFGTMAIRPIAWTDADRSTSELLMTYWTNFVKTGNPSGEGMTNWPAFSDESPKVMYFRDGKSEIGPVPHEARLALFDPLDRGAE